MRLSDTPNVNQSALHAINKKLLVKAGDPDYSPRILVLYGSLRKHSYSRLMSEEASRILQLLGAETKTFAPHNLPHTDADDGSHTKVRELHELTIWSDGMVWVSPERHGAISAVLKTQIDWLPLETGGVYPAQGKTLALCQVSGGSQSFNTLNQMRIIGRWLRMVVIPNQSSVPQAFKEFNDSGRMYPSVHYNRMVDVMEELLKFTWLTRGRLTYLSDRYSDRVTTTNNLLKG
ncbi:MAG TPA: NADPH-dependent FMN reductase ArsH [Hyphomicrobiaceae bacterium MAG_BT-2024]